MLHTNGGSKVDQHQFSVGFACHAICWLSVFSQNTKGQAAASNSSSNKKKRIRTADMRDSIEHNVMEFDPIPVRLCYLATCYITESNRSRLDVGYVASSWVIYTDLKLTHVKIVRKDKFFTLTVLFIKLWWTRRFERECIHGLLLFDKDGLGLQQIFVPLNIFSLNN
ncbi:hypothetical protein T10_11069 [Trichinella papuae]|uniref:Uncharacterized protein n=1 Tax=Trichinella papuae TaxID=268474 RepID=A0A0V1M703_9BILA|nr:hypothetical protein T10_11069 [Trichinella papuae]